MNHLIPLLLFIFRISSQVQRTDISDAANKKKVIKMGFFSSLAGNTPLEYENYIKDQLS